jgi:exodeoxyribonuclease-3
MKLATFNVNGINGRLPVPLRWLDETAPDIVCLQELKASQDKFPVRPIRDAGYGAIWHGQKSSNRRRHPGALDRSRRNAARPAWRS